MEPLAIISQYYPPASRGYQILARHGEQVATKALAVAARLEPCRIQPDFLYESAMLHDMGMFLTHAPMLGCHGRYPYICHGFLGRQILDQAGWPRHARVCERHIGTGITVADISAAGLPLPRRDMQPRTLEEKIVAFADKFFSKNGDGHEKSIPQILAELAPFGADKIRTFDRWLTEFNGHE